MNIYEILGREVVFKDKIENASLQLSRVQNREFLEEKLFDINSAIEYLQEAKQEIDALIESEKEDRNDSEIE